MIDLKLGLTLIVPSGWLDSKSESNHSVEVDFMYFGFMHFEIIFVFHKFRKYFLLMSFRAFS